VRPFAHVPSSFLLFALTVAPAIAFAAPAADETDLRARRLQLERRELELEKEALRIEERRRELEAERKKLTEESAVREVITIQLQGEVLFDFGKAQIRPRSEGTLEKVAAVIQQFPDGEVTIVGHTDSVGTPEANLALSRARAQAVRDWFVGKGGLEAPRIAVEGYGETLPIAPNQSPDGVDDPVGRQKNRRVEIRIAEVERRSAEVEAALKELGAEETDESLTIDLSGDVLFEFGKAAILPEAEKTLAKVAIVLAQFPDGVVRIDGYTDSKGPEEANRVLSQQRAEAVKAWLSERADIPASRVEAKGLGEADPVAPNTKPDGSDNPEGRKKNRRVEIVLTK
jgi:outer membrane protein OmpA-like peptidoglycan-associated protein